MEDPLLQRWIHGMALSALGSAKELRTLRVAIANLHSAPLGFAGSGCENGNRGDKACIHRKSQQSTSSQRIEA